MWADLVLFDPATVIDNSTFDEPFKLASGIRGTWVNGIARVGRTEADGRAAGTGDYAGQEIGAVGELLNS